MAEGSNICCGICKEFSTLIRKLPCDHIFCEKCLRDFVCYQYDKYGYFPCPHCKFGIIVPTGGLGQFKSDKEYHSKKNTDLILFHKDSSKDLILKEPVGLTCTSDNLIAITDRVGNKLLFFTLQRQLISQFSYQVKLNSLIISDNKTLLVTNEDIHTPLVLEINMDGVKCGFIDTLDKMVATNGIALLKNSKQIVVSSVETCTLFILSESGKLLKKYSGKALLGDPYFLSTTNKDEIIVSDHLNHFIKIIDHRGKIKYQMGGVGKHAGNLFQPKGVCVDRNDNIIVADSGNRCVKCFSRAGKFLRILTCCSDYSNKPVNVALTRDEEYLIVLLISDLPHFEIIEYICPK